MTVPLLAGIRSLSYETGSQHRGVLPLAHALGPGQGPPQSGGTMLHNASLFVRVRRVVPLLLFTSLLPAIGACAGGESDTLAMASPEWERFRWLVATQDSLQDALDRLKQEYPAVVGLLDRRDELLRQFAEAEQQSAGFASNPELVPKAFVADRRATSLWDAMQGGVPTLPEAPDLAGLEMNDLHVLEMAARSSRPFRHDLLLPIAKARLDLSTDEDTRRTAKLEVLGEMARQAPGGFQPWNGDLELATALASEDVLALADGFPKGRVYGSLSLGYLEAGEVAEARSYALESLKHTGVDGGHRRRDVREQSHSRPGPMIHRMEDAGDLVASAALAVEPLLPNGIPWAEIRASIDEELAQA